MSQRDQRPMSQRDQRPMSPRGDRPGSPYRIAALVLGVCALLLVCWFVVGAITSILQP